MALKDQPYFPFYVKDFDGDEKLRECDAEATGVYIRIMCLMHKSKTYGKILLEQKYQQTYQQNKQQMSQQVSQQVSSKCSDFAGAFAIKFVRYLPYTLLEIHRGLCQLLENGVLYMEGEYLCQKRMIKDNDISEKRASAGRKSASGGGGAKNFKAKKQDSKDKSVGNFVPTNQPTKDQQNTAIAIAIENVIENEGDNKGGIGNTEGVQGENFSGEKEEDSEIDHYEGNWTLRTSIKNCFNYYFTHQDFADDRELGFEIFKRQYVKGTDEEIWSKLKIWATVFTERKAGSNPEMGMRGHDSWVGWFHNWLKTQDLSSDPMANKNRFAKIEPKNNLASTKGMTREELEKYYSNDHLKQRINGNK